MIKSKSQILFQLDEMMVVITEYAQFVSEAEAKRAAEKTVPEEETRKEEEKASSEGEREAAVDIEELKKQSFAEGRLAGKEEGTQEGESQGFQEGLKEGEKRGQQEGHKAGFKEGFESGDKTAQTEKKNHSGEVVRLVSTLFALNSLLDRSAHIQPAVHFSDFFTGEQFQAFKYIWNRVVSEIVNNATLSASVDNIESFILHLLQRSTTTVLSACGRIPNAKHQIF